jgi:hypothetical protein
MVKADTVWSTTFGLGYLTSELLGVLGRAVETPEEHDA